MSLFLHNCTYLTFDLTVTLNRKITLGTGIHPYIFVIAQEIILAWMPNIIKKCIRSHRRYYRRQTIYLHLLSLFLHDHHRERLPYAQSCRTLTDICFSKLTVCRVRILTNFTLPVLILSLSGRRSNHSYGHFIH